MMGEKIFLSKRICVLLLLTIVLSSLAGTSPQTVLGYEQLSTPISFTEMNEESRIAGAELHEDIDGGTIAYSMNATFNDQISVWYSETTASTPRGSLFVIGIALVNEYLIPGNQFTAILYIKPVSFADQNTVDFHDIIFYYRVFDSSGQVLFNGTFDQMYNDWFELYLNSGEDHLGFGTFTFTVPTWASNGKSYHEVKAVFREDVQGEVDPINEVGWYRLIEADVSTTTGTNTGIKSAFEFYMDYEASWSMTIEQVASTNYYVEMNGGDYSIKVLSYYSKFLAYNLTALGNDGVMVMTLNDTGETVFYDDLWNYGIVMKPYSMGYLYDTVFSGTIDGRTNQWTNVARKNSISSFFLGIFPNYFGWGWGQFRGLPTTGQDAFTTDDLLVFLGNASEYSTGDSLGSMKLISKGNRTYVDVSLEAIALDYSATDCSQDIQKIVSTQYGVLLEEKSSYSLSYQTSEKWQAIVNTQRNVVITSLQFIDTTPPKVISETEFSVYEGVIPKITLEIEEKFPKEYSLYRDDLLIDSGEWNSTKLTLFLEKLPSGLYEYDLYLKDKMGNWGYKKITLRVMEPTPPSPPENLIVSIQEQGVLLSWKPPKEDGGSQLINYVVYRRMVNETNYSFLGNTTATQYLDNNVVTGQVYYYIVTAVNAIGESRPSNEGQIVIPTSISLDTNAGSKDSSGFLKLSAFTIYIPLVFLAMGYATIKRRK